MDAAAAARVARRTRTLGLFAGASMVALLGAELARIWRLGSLPLERGDRGVLEQSRHSTGQMVQIVREGYRVSSTRQNALFNMVASYVLAFGATRWVTYSIRSRGRLGPIRDVQVGRRHVHHFVPGAVIAMLSGGVSIAAHRPELDRLLAVPFGTGVALVLDESALLLELEDVYWSEEGIVSVQIALAAVALLAALAYFVQMTARGEMRVLETDWKTAAQAWDDLQRLRSA